MKSHLFAVIIIIFNFLQITKGQSLQEMLDIDFSETQLTYYDPMDCHEATFLYKVKNIGNKTLHIISDRYMFDGQSINHLVGPQGSSYLEPGESMWFRVVFDTRLFGYDYTIKQDITKTIETNIHDFIEQYGPGESNRITITKQIVIKVSGVENSTGNTNVEVPIKLTVLDENGNSTNAKVEIRGPSGQFNAWYEKDVINGKLEMKPPLSSKYFLWIKKDGYKIVFRECSLNNLNSEIIIQLKEKKDKPTLPKFTLRKAIKGDIGFWRGATTKLGDKILFVNGMENYYDQNMCFQGKLLLFDLNNNNIVWQYDIPFVSVSADIDDEGKYAAVSTALWNFSQFSAPTSIIALVDATNGQEIWKKTITKNNYPDLWNDNGECLCVKLSHNGNYLFAAITNEKSYLYNTSDGSIKWIFNYAENIREIIFSDDDQYIYVPTGSGVIYKLRVSDGSIVWKQRGWSWAYINGFELSFDKKYLAVGAKAGGYSIIDCETGSLIFSDKGLNNGSSTVKWINKNNDLICIGNSFSKIYDINGNLKSFGSFGGTYLFGNVLVTCVGALFDFRDGEYLGQGFKINEEGRISHFFFYNEKLSKMVWAVTETRGKNENIIEVYDVDYINDINKKDNHPLLSEYKLYQNYPNPFNPITKIEYSLPENSFVEIKIYDIFGKEVETLINKKQTMGMYSLQWQPKNITSGIYFYRIKAGKYSETKKMVYIK